MNRGTWVLLAALAGATVFGGWRAAREGRFRGLHSLEATASAPVVSSPTAAVDDLDRRLRHDLGQSLGERATLLQFSSAFCAPCRATRRVLGDVADVVPGVVHIEIDAERSLALVRRLDIHRTPTTLVLDGRGHEVSRASGAPRKDEVLATLVRVLDVTHGRIADSVSK